MPEELNYQQYIYQPAIYKTSDGIYHIVFGYYDLNDADEFILAYQETVEANDLVLENVSASEQNYANGRQTATISVGNEGVKDASGFTVDVYEDDDWIDTVDVNESIASGEEKEIEITFSKSVSKEVQTYRFVINQDEDRNTKNNEQEIKLGYADVSLKATEYYHDNIIDVYAQISNLTARNADVESIRRFVRWRYCFPENDQRCHECRFCCCSI